MLDSTTVLVSKQLNIVMQPLNIEVHRFELDLAVTAFHVQLEE